MSNCWLLQIRFLKTQNRENHVFGVFKMFLHFSPNGGHFFKIKTAFLSCIFFFPQKRDGAGADENPPFEKSPSWDAATETGGPKAPCTIQF